MAQPSQYYGPYSTDGTGFRVMIHDQNEWPDVENHGIDISPGINTVIPIERKKVCYGSLGEQCNSYSCKFIEIHREGATNIICVVLLTWKGRQNFAYNISEVRNSSDGFGILFYFSAKS